MHTSTTRNRLIPAFVAGLILVTAVPGCRSSARDDYMATRNIRVAPTEAGDEPTGVADAGTDQAEPPDR